jgi:hypothetical protein
MIHPEGARSMRWKKGRMLFVTGFFIAAVLPVQAQDAATIRRASAFVKKVPPRATLAKLRSLLPKGTRLGARSVATQGAGKTWLAQPFSGSINGQFVFFNTRRAAQRKPGMPPPPPFNSGNKILMGNDAMHSIEIVLGPPLDGKPGALTTRTRNYVEALSRHFGKPSFKKNNGESGGPDATGWTAQWKLPGGRTVEFIHSFSLLGSQEHPLLQLRFPYSQIYQS